MSEFSFKEIDEEGMETLKAISEANKFNEWMYQRIAPDCSGKILEIGSGIGNISEFFIKDKAEIYLSDLRDNYLSFLERNYTNKAAGILKMDIVDEDFDELYKNVLGTFDTVFALNVVEHIKDDELALKNITKLLKPNGTVIILVPAFNTLYNSFDEALEHYRRYTKKTLNKNFASSNLEIQKSSYFNAAGIAGWILSGAILKKKTIPAGQMKLYNKLVPIFKVVDKVLFNSFGLSVITVGKK